MTRESERSGQGTVASPLTYRADDTAPASRVIKAPVDLVRGISDDPADLKWAAKLAGEARNWRRK